MSTKWWYAQSGSNKLQAKIGAWRERYLIAIEELPSRIAEKVDANNDGKVSFQDIVAVTPTNKTAIIGEKLGAHRKRFEHVFFSSK